MNVTSIRTVYPTRLIIIMDIVVVTNVVNTVCICIVRIALSITSIIGIF